MAKKKYLVDLSDAEHDELKRLIRSGKHSSRRVTRARILLKAAAGCTAQEIVQALSVGVATVERTRQRFVETGLGALNKRPRPGTRPKLDARSEARLLAEACRAAPDGQKRWTVPLLAERVIELKLAESYSYEAVRRVLKKTVSSRG
jgi:transposase